MESAGEEVQQEIRPVDLAKVEGRYDLLSKLVTALWIVALWFPFKAIQPIADSLAGEDTNLGITISISLAFAGASWIGTAVTLYRSKKQRHEIERLRKRSIDLEKELAAMKGGA